MGDQPPNSDGPRDTQTDEDTTGGAGAAGTGVSSWPPNAKLASLMGAGDRFTDHTSRSTADQPAVLARDRLLQEDARERRDSRGDRQPPPPPPPPPPPRGLRRRVDPGRCGARGGKAAGIILTAMCSRNGRKCRKKRKKNA